MKTGGRRAGAAFVLAAFAAACWQSVAAEEIESCLAEKFLITELHCLSEAAEAANDPKLCLLSERSAVRFNCVSRYAERVGDPAICARIPADDVSTPGVLQETCRVGLAISLDDPKLCTGLTTPNLTDACYLQLVEAGADRALCLRIENAIIKAACGGERIIVDLEASSCRQSPFGSSNDQPTDPQVDDS